jgi:hypothetical protein
MFLKVMYTSEEGTAKSDGDLTKGHSMIEIIRYEFFTNINGEQMLEYFTVAGERIIHPLLGNVYVMNDSGQTINRFKPG